MIRPQILAGMKQAHGFAAARVEGRYVTPFTPIAEGASKIFEIREAAMLAADDVIDMRPECDIVFVDQAIFATMVRAPGDFAAKRLANVTAHWQESVAPVPSPFSRCVPTP